MHNRMRALQEQIYACTQNHVETASTEELGQAVDMIKDLAEGIYYELKAKEIEKELECMEEQKKAKEHCHIIPYIVERDIDKSMGRMYYSEPHYLNRMENDSQYRDKDMENDARYHDRGVGYDHEREIPMEFRDSREGRSPMSRRNYMESKEMHQGKDKKIKELEKYMQELSDDIVEMIEGASIEERQLLEKKMTHLTSKIAQLNTNA